MTFGYIWLKAFYNDPDYLQPLPADEKANLAIAQKNTWQSIYSIVLFMLAFAYLQPYIEITQNPWL